MIDLYFWPTPNAYKILIFLEEAKVEYRIIPVNILRGDQFKPEFLEVSPNNRIPAIVDYKPVDTGDKISIFESGCLLMYLAEKTGQFLSTNLRNRYKTIQWLMWQIGGIGPMMGQANYFLNYTLEDIPYAKDRYVKELKRLCGVIDKHLSKQDYLSEDYSIADMACYPWIKFVDHINIDLNEYSKLADWVARITKRSAVQRAYTLGEPIQGEHQLDDEARHILFK